MVARAYGQALSDEEIEDVYSAAWAATLSALRTRGEGMSNEELRAYVLTAVASHASKELRRRSRKPTGSLDEGSEQSMADRHQPLPEERAIGSETQGVARDLLSSLPPRRRAVMLLRYGWGLSPTEVCALVAGLSARAYRKEVTRGVEQLIERLKQVESGEWCASREPLLRDLVAGTADEQVERQAREHIQHCRACAAFTARLNGHLHDFGGAFALTTVAGQIGTQKLPALERLGSAFQGARDGTAAAADRSESALGAVASSGGARGSGAAGAGILAKVAGAGGAGKAVLACIGAGAAASACVVAGVVPGVGIGDSGDEPRPERERTASPRDAHPQGSEVAAEPIFVPPASETPVIDPALQPSATPTEPSDPPNDHEPSEAEVEPKPSAPPEQEFDPAAPAPPSSEPVAAAPISPPAASPVPASSASGSGASTAQNEFGP